MKFWFLILVVIVVLVSCSGDRGQIPAKVVNIPNTASGESSKDGLPVLEFALLEHDFGKVIQGEIVTYAFKFKNTGKSDLVIANISASCGCTASDYPKTPVKPGEEQVVKVSFDSTGKEGFQRKTLEVAANTQPSNTVLSITAIVINPEKQ
jgi:hypothetical protein